MSANKLQTALSKAKGAIDIGKLLAILQLLGPVIQAVLDMLAKNPSAAASALKEKGCDDKTCEAVKKLHGAIESSAMSLLELIEAHDAICEAMGCPTDADGDDGG